MYSLVKVAAISMKPRPWDKIVNADRMEAFFVRAARRKAQVALCPEGVLEGYLVMQVIEQPDLKGRMEEVAEPIDGPYIRRFRRLAYKLRMCLAFGFAERRRDGVYNCAIFITHRGEIAGTHHKTQFAEGYHRSWSFNRIGRGLRAFDTPFGRAGFVICNERWNPQIARTIVLDGAQVIYIPSYGSLSRAQNMNVLARGRENGVPIVEANVGLNLIVSKGEIVAYHWGHDHLTIADIDIPAKPSVYAACQSERRYLLLQGPEMRKRYIKTMKKLKKRRGR